MVCVPDMWPSEPIWRQRHIGDPGIRKPRMRVDGKIPHANGDSLARLHALSHEGFNVGIGTIQVDGPVGPDCSSILIRVWFSFSGFSPGWRAEAPLPNLPIPLVSGEAAQLQGFMGPDAGFRPRLRTCREEPQRSQPQGAGSPLQESTAKAETGTGHGSRMRLLPSWVQVRRGQGYFTNCNSHCLTMWRGSR